MPRAPRKGKYTVAGGKSENNLVTDVRVVPINLVPFTPVTIFFIWTSIRNRCHLSSIGMGDVGVCSMPYAPKSRLWHYCLVVATRRNLGKWAIDWGPSSGALVTEFESSARCPLHPRKLPHGEVSCKHLCTACIGHLLSDMPYAMGHYWARIRELFCTT